MTCLVPGVIHKKPDIRHKSPEDIQRLPVTQKNILLAASKYLKPGGRLLYSTCTLNKAENDDITDAFLSENSGFGRVTKTTMFPTLKNGIVENDGFFIDVLERIK